MPWQALPHLLLGRPGVSRRAGLRAEAPAGHPLHQLRRRDRPVFRPVRLHRPAQPGRDLEPDLELRDPVLVRRRRPLEPLPVGDRPGAPPLEELVEVDLAVPVVVDLNTVREGGGAGGRAGDKRFASVRAGGGVVPKGRKDRQRKCTRKGSAVGREGRTRLRVCRHQEDKRLLAPHLGQHGVDVDLGLAHLGKHPAELVRVERAGAVGVDLLPDLLDLDL
eukprot:SAG22_NODE_949_length_6356_cov_2.100527_5_plen_220_part_00